MMCLRLPAQLQYARGLLRLLHRNFGIRQPVLLQKELLLEKLAPLGRRTDGQPIVLTKQLIGIAIDQRNGAVRVLVLHRDLNQAVLVRDELRTLAQHRRCAIEIGNLVPIHQVEAIDHVVGHQIRLQNRDVEVCRILPKIGPHTGKCRQSAQLAQQRGAGLLLLRRHDGPIRLVKRSRAKNRDDRDHQPRQRPPEDQPLALRKDEQHVQHVQPADAPVFSFYNLAQFVITASAPAPRAIEEKSCAKFSRLRMPLPR